MFVAVDGDSIIVDGKVKLDIELRGSVMIIMGNSATGKTLLYNTIADCLDAERLTGKKYISSALPFKLINFRSENIHIEDGFLYIIDNADIVIDKSISDAIMLHREHSRFIIFGRDSYNLDLSPNYFGELYQDGDTIRTKYKYSDRGWW